MRSRRARPVRSTAPHQPARRSPVAGRHGGLRPSPAAAPLREAEAPALSGELPTTYAQHGVEHRMPPGSAFGVPGAAVSWVRLNQPLIDALIGIGIGQALLNPRNMRQIKRRRRIGGSQGASTDENGLGALQPLLVKPCHAKTVENFRCIWRFFKRSQKRRQRIR